MIRYTKEERKYRVDCTLCLLHRINVQSGAACSMQCQRSASVPSLLLPGLAVLSAIELSALLLCYSCQARQCSMRLKCPNRTAVVKVLEPHGIAVAATAAVPAGCEALNAWATAGTTPTDCCREHRPDALSISCTHVAMVRFLTCHLITRLGCLPALSLLKNGLLAASISLQRPAVIPQTFGTNTTSCKR